VFFLRRFVAVVLSMLGCRGSGRWESQQRHRCAGSRPGLQSRGGGRCDQQRARRDSSAPARCHRPCPPQPCQLEAACADPGVPGSVGGSWAQGLGAGTTSSIQGSGSSPSSASRGSAEGSLCCRKVQVPASFICHSLVPIFLLASPCWAFLCLLVLLLLLGCVSKHCPA